MAVDLGAAKRVLSARTVATADAGGLTSVWGNRRVSEPGGADAVMPLPTTYSVNAAAAARASTTLFNVQYGP